jgi:F-type H+-transporting ATPase subunit delta
MRRTSTDMIVARRYAEAFLKYAREATGIERAVRDLRQLKLAINEIPALTEFFEHPVIPVQEKKEFIDRIISNGFSGELRDFLKLLVDKGRIALLTDIIEYVRVTYTHEGVTDVLLKTSFPLDVDVIESIESAIQAKLGRACRFYIELDARLLGGIQVVVGNTVIDASVRKRFDELREKLMGVNV